MTIQVPDFTVELASRLLFRLGRHRLTVATAESLTGGLVAGAITSVPGSSAWFRGGVVAYATDVKAGVLGVDAGLLEENGPVSPITAGAMAEAARALFGADLGIATTGVAGPDPVDGVSPGVMYVAASLRRTEAAVRRLDCFGDRASLRGTCVIEALDQALQTLEMLPGGE
jgi:nicotinamide-nucleotide amidase